VKPRVSLALLAVCCAAPLAAQTLALPKRQGSVRFLVFGDTGTGDASEYDVGNQIFRYYKVFPFPFAIMLGDNIYGSERPQDFDTKFIKPYRALLDAKVEFNATLGNHDDPNQRFYKPFNMGGNRYRTFQKGNVRFYVIDSNYLDPDQRKWLEAELASAGSSVWKIAYFHHPLYTTAARGPEVELRKVLEPLFIKYGVDIVFSGHEHIYERLKPQQGILYFTVGGGAKLRAGDAHQGPLADAVFATDRSFMLVEIAGTTMYYQALSRTGTTIDKGVYQKRKVPAGRSTIGPVAPPPKQPAPKKP